MSNLDKSTVCMVVYNKYPMDTRVRRAAESLSNAGYKVHVVCTSEEGVPEEDEYNKVHIHRVKVQKGSGAKLSNFLSVAAFMFRATGKVISISRTFRPFYYHVHSLPDFLVAVVLIPKMTGSRVVLDLHESFPEIVLARFNKGARLLALLASWLERLSCIFADHVIVVNDKIAKLVEQRGEQPDKITVIMNSPRMNNAYLSNNHLQKEVVLSKKTGNPLCIYAGGLNQERDLLTLIEAVHKLREKKISLNVLFFTHTETPYLKEIEQYINKFELQYMVRFCGHLAPEEVIPNLRASNIGIVTYVRNPLTEIALPNKVFEYIEAGCPLVVSNLNALRDLLGDAANYYSPGDPISLAEAIQITLLNPGNPDKILKANKVYQTCAWPVMEKRLLEVYEKLKV